MDQLFLLLNREDIDEELKKAELGKFYKAYIGETQEFYLNSSQQEILAHLKDEYGVEELITRVEMLSEILYQDGMLESNLEKKSMKLLKTLSFLDYLDEYSGIYSIVREGKIEEIKTMLD